MNSTSYSCPQHYIITVLHIETNKAIWVIETVLHLPALCGWTGRRLITTAVVSIFWRMKDFKSTSVEKIIHHYTYKKALQLHCTVYLLTTRFIEAKGQQHSLTTYCTTFITAQQFITGSGFTEVHFKMWGNWESLVTCDRELRLINICPLVCESMGDSYTETADARKTWALTPVAAQKISAVKYLGNWYLLASGITEETYIMHLMAELLQLN